QDRPLPALRSRAAVVALPHSLLRGGSLHFDPALPEKARAARLLEVGQVFKIVFQFKEEFWAPEDFVEERAAKGSRPDPDLSFLVAGDQRVPVWWTTAPSRVPILNGWVGGPRAERIVALRPRERIEIALDSL